MAKKIPVWLQPGQVVDASCYIPSMPRQKLEGEVRVVRSYYRANCQSGILVDVLDEHGFRDYGIDSTWFKEDFIRRWGNPRLGNPQPPDVGVEP